jgi:serine/threonine-protein kinase
MADVFLVEHRHLERRFVAKVLRPALALIPQMVDRMRLEAQTLGRISHANIVAITNFGLTSDGRPFIVMEQLRGRTLRAELTEQGALPVVRAIRYACELLAGLSAAHELGVVHRDIEPSNLFLAESPLHRPTLKILDFGIARVLPDAAAHAPMPLAIPTATGHIVGPPRFVSPEGATGARVDARADLYGAALVLYTMLSGRGPFDHVASDQDVRTAHSVEEPVAPSRCARGPVPVELDRLVLRALEKDPDARFQTAAAFRAELEQVASLLGQPAGWLDTTAFDGTAFELLASGPSDGGVPARRDMTAPSRLEHEAARAGERRRAAVPHQVRAAGASVSARMLGLLFLIGVVLTTLLALALARLVASG